MRVLLTILIVFSVAACGNGGIYVRDGVTDGDTFYLADRAFTDDDPVLQSWVAYSLARSVCQLDIGGPNPARVSDYGCEFSARLLMLDTWEENLAKNPALKDVYFDDLLRVREAGFLDEYVVDHYGTRDWQVPAEVDLVAFQTWQRVNLRGHEPQTRLIGSWNYSVLTSHSSNAHRPETTAPSGSRAN